MGMGEIQRGRIAGIVLLVLMVVLPAVVQAASVSRDEVRELLRLKVENSGFGCRGEMVCGTELLPDLYSGSDFAPLWNEVQGRELVNVLANATQEGFRPEDYHYGVLAELLDAASGGAADADHLADLDILLTDGFLLYASHILAGRVDPETVHPDWIPAGRTMDLRELLHRGLSRGIAGVLDELRPPHAGYLAMRDALAAYRNLAELGGWPVLAPGPSLRLEDSGSGVRALRRRLAMEGDLVETSGLEGNGTTAMFDAGLEQAVMRFQARHGLEQDGVVGPRTRAALNVPVAERVRQLEINLERWRWIAAELGDKYVLVNIADFRLQVVENGTTVLEMPVVVGKNYRQTPVFSKKMQYLVLNPYWNVPHSLASEDVLAKVRRNPDYLVSQGFEVFDSWSRDATPMDVSGIDWNSISSARFPYRLRQKPGPENALGRIKFMFPNRFAVYLHDTPSKSLFSRSVRNFSSGCIRVQRPVQLAAYLLQDQPGWSEEEIRAVIEAGEQKSISLKRMVPVHLQYWTAWVDEQGAVNFRQDIYGRDQALQAALDKRPSPGRELAVHLKQ